MIISDHAKDRMSRKGISEEEVKKCAYEGILRTKTVINGEIRHVNVLQMKDKTIVTVQTFESLERKIITVYLLMRKRWPK